MRLGAGPVSISWRDLVRDHARLARARARQHQAGAIDEVHGLELGAVQTRRNNKTIAREKPNRARGSGKQKSARHC